MEQRVRKYKRIWYLFVAVVIVFNLIFGFYLLKNKKLNLPKVDKSLVQISIPFEELTIPYLRTLKYESKLGELNQATDSEIYTGYLTSYTSDGLKINGYLTIPKGEEPKNGWPAIVFIHGYIPPSQYQTLEKYSEYVDYLARQGFVVFKIDLRGHGKSEGEATGAYYSSDYVVDALSARSALQNSNFVNKNKVGLWGHSMAGNVVLRSLAVKPEIPAAVIWAGAVYSYEDREKYGIRDSSYRPPQSATTLIRRRQELFNKYGEFDPGSKFWKTVAATNYLNDLKGAIQLNHAVDDDVVNVGYSRDLVKLLDTTNVEHELNEYPSGGHNISGISFNLAMENTSNFFHKYLSN